MAEYELVREIPNLCRNNQMRDIFFEEVETEDPVAYVRRLGKIQGRDHCGNPFRRRGDSLRCGRRPDTEIYLYAYLIIKETDPAYGFHRSGQLFYF